MRRKDTHREGFGEIGAAIDQQLEHVHETFISSPDKRCPSVLRIVSTIFLMKGAEMKKVIARRGSRTSSALFTSAFALISSSRDATWFFCAAMYTGVPPF